MDKKKSTQKKKIQKKESSECKSIYSFLRRTKLNYDKKDSMSFLVAVLILLGISFVSLLFFSQVGIETFLEKIFFSFMYIVTTTLSILLTYSIFYIFMNANLEKRRKFFLGFPFFYLPLYLFSYLTSLINLIFRDALFLRSIALFLVLGLLSYISIVTIRNFSELYNYKYLKVFSYLILTATVIIAISYNFSKIPSFVNI